LGAAGLATCARAAANSKPNVLFIAIDDMNDWIGVMKGHPQTKTPHLDKLAASGAMFTSAHCAAPLCNPSRTAIMTGLRPSSTGVYLNSQPFRGSKVLASEMTLNRHFRDEGYRVIGGGKIYHGTDSKKFSDVEGWDEYCGEHSGAGFKGKGPLNGIPGSGNLDWGPLDAPDEEMNDWKIGDWAIGKLKQKFEQPTFLAYGVAKPHLPWYVPRKYFDMFPLDSIELPIAKEDDLDDVPPIGVKFAKAQGDHARITKADAWKRAVQAYLAAIAFSDACVGRVLRALESGPNAANTMVILWSDHGWHLGEKSHWRKFTLWERSTRNLLMMRVPGVTKAGARIAHPVSLLDLYPTLTGLCGLKPKKTDGEDLTPWLKNPKAPKATPAITTYYRNNHAIRTADWRYIRYEDGGEELYDVRKDPNEWTNLAANPAYASRKSELARWLPAVNYENAPEQRGSVD
jgi:arylsulfatase A-like enzyme